MLDDLVIISSLCQDSIIKEHEYGYDKKSKRFAILMNRFCHESNDQKRIMSPKEAFKNGATSIVRGRSLVNGNIKRLNG